MRYQIEHKQNEGPNFTPYIILLSCSVTFTITQHNPLPSTPITILLEKMTTSSSCLSLTNLSSQFYPSQFSKSTKLPLPPISKSTKLPPPLPLQLQNHSRSSHVKTRSLGEFSSGSFFEDRGFGSDEDPDSLTGGSSGAAGAVAVEDKEPPPCPPGLRRYETMTVLRPDMTEDERLAFTRKYEELLVAGGGMYVEVFNRGVVPLAYSIRKRNKAGETNTYLDGIYLLFTYFTKPESMSTLEVALNADDDVIRFSSFKFKKRKY